MKSHVDISSLSSMNIGGKVDSLSMIKTLLQVRKFINEAKASGRPHIIIGGGTNIVFNDRFLDISIGKIEIMGISIVKENDSNTLVRVCAGENWDRLVEKTVSMGLSGAEALSSIPGTVGAAPIQNIGAYGSEVREIIVEINAYDTISEKMVIIKNADAGFSYRDSIFKRNPNRWVIASVLFSFKNNPNPPIPDYKDVKNYFDLQINSSPSLSQIREAIIEIRKKKLPDPKVVPNCGSFFKNPVVNKNLANKIKLNYADLPIYPAGKDTKIPAGFLIEKAGFKGKEISGIKVYEHNALVLTNPNNATFTDLIKAKDAIQKSVFDMFGVILEPEVNLIY